jgi:hypothetical protein
VNSKPKSGFVAFAQGASPIKGPNPAWLSGRQVYSDSYIRVRAVMPTSTVITSFSLVYFHLPLSPCLCLL